MSHHSGNLYGGHYVGSVINLDNGQWYDCNDSHVSKTYLSSASTTAYVLFFI